MRELLTLLTKTLMSKRREVFCLFQAVIIPHWMRSYSPNYFHALRSTLLFINRSQFSKSNARESSIITTE